jgi:glycosyltransferase involved in cell wall biosynthesis
MTRVFYLMSERGAAGPRGALPGDRFAVERGCAADGFRKLRASLTRFAPDVLHAVGPAAARFARLLTRRAKVVASGVEEAGWFTRRALRSADRVVAATHAEAARYHALGVPRERTVVIPPGVDAAPPPPDAVAFRRAWDIPDSGRLIIAAGRFDASAGLRSAAWAFDVLKYAAPDAYLVLVGAGPEREPIEQFARSLGFDDYRVRFTGWRDDLPALFGLAEVAWVTHERGGLSVALQALAAGRPVVAAHTPELAEVIENGVSGRLVAPTDRVGRAAVTRELLNDPVAARQLGDAGRDRAVKQHAAEAATGRYAELYEELASSRPRPRSAHTRA